jgi:hypothetical protein
LLTRLGFGEIAIAKINVAIKRDLKAVKRASLLNAWFLLNYFATLKIKRTTVARFKQQALLRCLFPLPLLSEQHCLVAKQLLEK